MNLDGIPFPIEPIRDLYVTPYGGRSDELKYNQVGINRRALDENTSLTPHLDKVTIKRMDGERVVPLYARSWFEIVPLERDRPKALAKSINGEAVLAEEAAIIKRPVYNETLILNSVLSKFLVDPEDWTKLLKTNPLLKKRPT